MSPDDMKLLMGELKEFKNAAMKRLDEIEKKVDSFQQFKTRVTGAIGVSSFIIVTLTDMAVTLTDLIKHH